MEVRLDLRQRKELAVHSGSNCQCKGNVPVSTGEWVDRNLVLLYDSSVVRMGVDAYPPENLRELRPVQIVKNICLFMTVSRGFLFTYEGKKTGDTGV